MSPIRTTSTWTIARSTATSSGCGASSGWWMPSSRGSRRSTASDTALAKTEDQDLSVNWTRRVAIRHRILAVNVFAILILAGSIFYLDGFRGRLTQARVERAAIEATMIARSVGAVPAQMREPLLVRMGQDSGARLRLYDRAEGG